MLYTTPIPHSSMSRSAKNVLLLGNLDNQHQDVFYCPSCKGPIVNSEYGIRRHILKAKPSTVVNPFFRIEPSSCEKELEKLGYLSTGKKK